MPVVTYAYMDKYERLLHEHNKLKDETAQLRAALADAQKRFDTLKVAYDAERRKPIVLHGSAAPAQKKTNDPDEIARLYAALNADPQTLRLHLGEMTAQEMRTLKAGFQWVLNRAALAQGGDA